MPQVFSSVNEACISILSGTVDVSPAPTGRRCSCTSIGSQWNVIVQVPDDEDIRRKEIDISALCKEDLCRLKTDDPFLYYSIPSMRRKSYLCDDGEEGDANMIESSSSSRRFSLPLDLRLPKDAQFKVAAKDTGRKETIVRRNCRLSTEAHPSLILEEMMLSEFQELDYEHEECDCDMEDIFELMFTEKPIHGELE